MTLVASVGIATGLDGRESGLQATHQALSGLGNLAPTLGIVLASHEYAAREVVSGVSSLLGETPFIGLSTPAVLDQEGYHSRAVLVALLAASDLWAEALWLPGYAQSSTDTAQRLIQLVQRTPNSQGMLFFADGFNGNIEQLCAALRLPNLTLAGGLSAGNPNTLSTFVLANLFQGSGALSAALLRGQVRMGVGYAHGWEPVGKQFRVTRARGFWVRMLDGRPASEAYAQLFGHPAREWAFPPLNTLVRMYPLGVVQEQGLRLCAPIRVEADGSFRLNLSVQDGSDALLLLSNQAACRQAILNATRQALNALGEAQPRLLLVLMDVAWNMVLRAVPGFEVRVLQEVVGNAVPIAAAYTLGQVVSSPTAESPQALNQHVVVVAFGE